MSPVSRNLKSKSVTEDVSKVKNDFFGSPTAKENLEMHNKALK